MLTCPMRKRETKTNSFCITRYEMTQALDSTWPRLTGMEDFSFTFSVLRGLQLQSKRRFASQINNGIRNVLS